MPWCQVLLPHATPLWCEALSSGKWVGEPKGGNRGGLRDFGTGHGFSNCQVDTNQRSEKVSVAPHCLKVVDFEFSSPMSRSQHLPMSRNRCWSRYAGRFVKFQDIDIKSTRYGSASVPIKLYVRNHIFVCECTKIPNCCFFGIFTDSRNLSSWIDEF